MATYISNKKIKNGKVNEVDNLKGIGEAVWKFISSLYESKWDSLIVDNNISFRKKVSEKFTPKIKEMNVSENKSGKSSDLLATFNTLPSPILAKSPKEVNEISKYFKKNQQSGEKKNQKIICSGFYSY